jgi:hypothetical protein
MATKIAAKAARTTIVNTPKSIRKSTCAFSQLIFRLQKAVFFVRATLVAAEAALTQLINFDVVRYYFEDSDTQGGDAWQVRFPV